MELRSLSLGNTKIESPTLRKSLGLESFAALDPLDRLETLNLSSVRVFDADLLDLAELDSLKHLHLGMDTGTVEGLYALKVKAPSIIISPSVLSRLNASVDPNEKGEIVAIREIFNKELERLGAAEDMGSVQSLPFSNAHCGQS